eukprot:2235510-Rhodomonas_salina.1
MPEIMLIGQVKGDFWRFDAGDEASREHESVCVRACVLCVSMYVCMCVCMRASVRRRGGDETSFSASRSISS